MIGENIRKIRELKGISMTVLAERALVSKSYLSNIERDLMTNPTINVLLRVSKVLEVELSALVAEDPEEYIPSPPISSDIDWWYVSREAEKAGISKQQLQNYKLLIDFITWKSKNEPE